MCNCYRNYFVCSTYMEITGVKDVDNIVYNMKQQIETYSVFNFIRDIIKNKLSDKEALALLKEHNYDLDEFVEVSCRHEQANDIGTWIKFTWWLDDDKGNKITDDFKYNTSSFFALWLCNFWEDESEETEEEEEIEDKNEQCLPITLRDFFTHILQIDV